MGDVRCYGCGNEVDATELIDRGAYGISHQRCRAQTYEKLLAQIQDLDVEAELRTAIQRLLSDALPLHSQAVVHLCRALSAIKNRI